MTLSLRACRLALCLSTVVLFGSVGCKSDGVQASGSGSASGSDLSGPPTFNEMFQTRNPRVCSKLMSVPNASQAAALVQCDLEAGSTPNGFTPILQLATEVKVEVESPRAYMPQDEFLDIDKTAPVYPIVGSGIEWVCGYARSSTPMMNCNRRGPTPNTTGFCWRTRSKDWRCSMGLGGELVLRVKGPTTY